MTEPFRFAPAISGTDPILGIALNWLNQKAFISQWPALFVPKAPLPVLGKAVNGQATRSLMTAINQRLGLIQYHSDPAGGTGDLYNHPEHTEWLLQHQSPTETRPRDCDDFAVYAFALARKAGVSPDHIWVWNLLVENQMRDVAWNHVIFGLTCQDAPGRVFVLDTCSASWQRPWEFTGTKWGVESAVRKAFGDAYRTTYKYLVEVPPPFGA